MPPEAQRHHLASKPLPPLLPATKIAESPVGQASFALGIALALYSSSPKQLDTVNSFAVLAVVGTLLGLVFLISPGIDADRLLIANWEEVIPAVPVILLAFVYQNIVPVIVTQLEGDMRKVTTAIVCGTAVPWAMFISWDAAVLGQRSQAALDFERVAVDPVAIVQAAGGPGGAQGGGGWSPPPAASKLRLGRRRSVTAPPSPTAQGRSWICSRSLRSGRRSSDSSSPSAVRRPSLWLALPATFCELMVRGLTPPLPALLLPRLPRRDERGGAHGPPRAPRLRRGGGAPTPRRAHLPGPLLPGPRGAPHAAPAAEEGASPPSARLTRGDPLPAARSRSMRACLACLCFGVLCRD